MNTLIRKYCLLLAIITLYAPMVYAQVPTHLKFRPKKASDFKPHMLGHIYDGCPDNSECSEEMGKIRKKWLSVLKNKNFRKNNYLASLKYFKKSHGVPIGFWFTPREKLPMEIIFWRSPCQHHNPKVQKDSKSPRTLKIAETLTPDFHKLIDMKNKGENILLAQTMTKNNKNQILTYYYPRGDHPILVNNNNLYFVREEEGNYYSMTVDQKGNIDIVKKYKVKEYPKEAQCPEDLHQLMESKHKDLNLYHSYYCKAIWNNTNKSFQTFIFGWSCN